MKYIPEKIEMTSRVLALDYKNAKFYVYRIFSVAEPTFARSPTKILYPGEDSVSFVTGGVSLDKLIVVLYNFIVGVGGHL